MNITYSLYIHCTYMIYTYMYRYMYRYIHVHTHIRHIYTIHIHVCTLYIHVHVTDISYNVLADVLKRSSKRLLLCCKTLHSILRT